MNEIIEKLAVAVKQSKLFRKRVDAANIEKVFDLFVEKHPEGPTSDEIKSKLNVSGNIGGTVNRVHDRLRECFLKDRSLWNHQKMLFIVRRGGKGNDTLEWCPLVKELSPTQRFWFWQCTRLPEAEDEKEDAKKPVDDTYQSCIVSSEPLFFFSKSLRGYFRLLDVNYDRPFEKDNINELVTSAKDRILEAIPSYTPSNAVIEFVKNTVSLPERTKTKIIKAIPKEIPSTAMIEFVKNLDLIPTKTYIPAGDSDAAVRIRRWFQETCHHDIGYREASHVAEEDFNTMNLIILASRSSLPLLARFQRINPQLQIQLTEEGITFGGRVLRDGVLEDDNKNQDFHLARVVVTNWTFDTDNVHTYIASNYTRALSAVARLLVNARAFAPVSQAIIQNGMIPRRFQLAFNVKLQINETQATIPQLLPELNGAAVIY